MKKFLLFIPFLLVLLSVSIVQAQTQNGCDPNAQWKNHGAYVSCVAKEHPGGQVVSEAARSDVGKKNNEVTPSITITPTPTVEPTGETTPTLTPTPTEEVTPTPTTEASPTPTGETTPTPTVETIAEEEFVNANGEEISSSIKNLIDTLKEFIKTLRDLI